MSVLKERAIKALGDIANGRAKVGRTGIDRQKVIARVERMAGQSSYSKSADFAQGRVQSHEARS